MLDQSQMRGLPSGSLAAEVISPAFSIKPPEVWNEELVGDSISGLGLMRSIWNKGTFPASPVTVHIVEDVFVIREGLVFDQNLNVFRETVTQHGAADIHQARDHLRQIGSELPMMEGQFVLTKKRGVLNYGHWMLEMLPRAYLARKLIGSAQRYIVPQAEGPLRDVVDTSLSLLGFHPDEIVPLDHMPVRVRRLVVVSGLTKHGVFMSPLVLDCIDALRTRVPPQGGEQLYVDRSSAAKRNFSNPSLVQTYAHDHGFTVMDPGVVPLEAQIAQFGKARLIVGVMGAGMTNIAFAPAKSTIVVCAPSTMSDTFFWFIAGLKEHRYIELRCPQQGENKGIARWNTDLSLSAADRARVFDPGLLSTGVES